MWWVGALVVVISAVMFYLSSKLTEVEGVRDSTMLSTLGLLQHQRL